MYVSVHYVCGFPANHLTVLLSINMEMAGKLDKKFNFWSGWDGFRNVTRNLLKNRQMLNFFFVLRNSVPFLIPAYH